MVFAESSGLEGIRPRSSDELQPGGASSEERKNEPIECSDDLPEFLFSNVQKNVNHPSMEDTLYLLLFSVLLSDEGRKTWITFPPYSLSCDC